MSVFICNERVVGAQSFLLFQVTGRNYPIRPKLFFNDNIMFRLVVSKVAHCRLVSMPVLVVFERIYIQTLL